MKLYNYTSPLLKRVSRFINLTHSPAFNTPTQITKLVKPPLETVPLTFLLETNKMKKVLVTGASGYLGGRLCHALLSHGYSVRAFVRPTSDLTTLSQYQDIEFSYGDVTDYASLLRAVSGCQVVFHAAALVEPWLPDPSAFVSVRRYPRPILRVPFD